MVRSKTPYFLYLSFVARKIVKNYYYFRFGYSTDEKNIGIVDDAPEHASRMTHEEDERVKKKAASVGVSGVLSILFVVGLLASLGMWVLYAYRNPHSASGQLLIRVSHLIH